MAFSKASLFPDDVYLLSLICMACSHPARIIILQRLLETKDYVGYNDLTADIELSPSTTSQHIAKLRQMDLITSRAVNNLTTEHRMNRRNSVMLNTLAAVLASHKGRHGIEL